MAAKKSGLGKGMDALFMDNATEESSSASAVKLSLFEIEPDKDQPRKNFDEEALSQLASSIAQHGVLQPLLVRPLPGGGYQLVAGERRWRAARMAGLNEVPVVIRTMTDEEADIFALIENLQREDLDPVEEAKGMQSLMTGYGMTQEQLSEKVGKSRPAVANALRLLKLPDTVLESITKGELSAGHGRALAAIDDSAKILEAAKTVIEKKLSVRETEKLVKALITEKKPREKRAPSRDAYFVEVELSLNETLGRRTKVKNEKGKEGGTIELDFYNKEDLARIAKALETLED